MAKKHATKQQKQVLIAGGIVTGIIIIAAAVAVFLLTQSAPKEAPTSEAPAVVEDAPAPAAPAKPATPTFPLTGLEAPDEAATLNRVLSVKIENTPDARPQTGLSSADVVYETVTEGGITRFNCLFQSKVPEEVGPVRSARLSDLSIVPQYDGLFFFSGANSYVNQQIRDAELSNMSHGKASSLYYRVGYREAPHNLYLSLADAYGRATEKGFATTVEKPRGLEFAVDSAGGGAGASGSDTDGATGDVWATAPSATHISLTFSFSYVAEWSWDAASASYLRSMDGPSIDAATNEQIAATNLIVLRTSYVDAPDDKTLFLSLNGTGEATLFIGGKRLEATWESDGKTPPRFRDPTGTPIPLTPGQTWFQVLDPTWNMSVS
jgi:hypothetical protein